MRRTQTRLLQKKPAFSLPLHSNNTKCDPTKATEVDGFPQIYCSTSDKRVWQRAQTNFNNLLFLVRPSRDLFETYDSFLKAMELGGQKRIVRTHHIIVFYRIKSIFCDHKRTTIFACFIFRYIAEVNGDGALRKAAPGDAQWDPFKERKLDHPTT
jgi:hypothetical protein